MGEIMKSGVPERVRISCPTCVTRICIKNNWKPVILLSSDELLI